MAVTSTVGGVTSGYWAIGSVNTATPPASTKTMEITDGEDGPIDEETRNHRSSVSVGLRCRQSSGALIEPRCSSVSG